MFQRKPRRFSRYRSNGRNHQRNPNGDGSTRIRPDTFNNGQRRNNFRPTQSAEKLFEKYSNLAKEAMSSGDKTLSENYLQHADHFMRIIDDKNRNRMQSKNDDQTVKENKTLPENPSPTQDQNIEDKKE